EKRDMDFTDGTTIIMTESEVHEIFDSAMRGDPSELAIQINNKRKQGIYDEGGLCFILEAYMMTKEETKQLWSDDGEF
ncbi:hypothetical protein, partial [Luteimonas abyssi]|uniref:hypothetical protein n=1 Tax=Luteimonas abyssi TaxID=1247514 RepID=UPI001EE48532